MCTTCEGNLQLASEPTTERVATSVELHSNLLRCGVCRQLFDHYPEGRQGPWPVSVERALELYPGAVPPSDQPDDSGPRL